MPGDAYVIRHGETEWSRSGRHTSTTDLPLTEAGRDAARALAPVFAHAQLAGVLSSPLQRARTTCELAGLGGRMVIEPDVTEWNYGDYEGLTHKEIEQRRPGWQLFIDGCPGGESPQQVAARIERLVARLRAEKGRVAVFAHGHILRALAVRWIAQPIATARHLLLDTSTVGLLGYNRQDPAIAVWNAPVGGPRLP